MSGIANNCLFCKQWIKKSYRNFVFFICLSFLLNKEYYLSNFITLAAFLLSSLPLPKNFLFSFIIVTSDFPWKVPSMTWFQWLDIFLTATYLFLCSQRGIFLAPKALDQRPPCLGDYGWSRFCPKLRNKYCLCFRYGW